MKTLLSIIVLATATAVYCPAQEADALFQQALVAERVQGDLDAAILLYERIVSEHPSDRAVVAKALLRAGFAQEALGMERASASYKKLIREYPEQQEQVAAARVRLIELAEPQKVTEKEPAIREIKLTNLFAPMPMMSAIFPDGRQLAETDWNTGDIAVQDLNTSKIEHLGLKEGDWEASTEYAEHKSVSPNGKLLAYTWFGTDLRYSLRVLDFETKKVRVLLEDQAALGSDSTIWVMPYGWSPDGKQVLARRSGSYDDLVLIQVDTGTAEVLHRFTQNFPGNACMLGDQSGIVFDSNSGSDEDFDIHLLSLNSKTVSPILAGPYDDRLLACRGTSIVIGSDRGIHYGAYTISDVREGDNGLIRLIDLPEAIFPVGISDDSRLFLGKRGLWRPVVQTGEVDFEAGKLLSAPKLFGNGGSYAGSIAWSSDGKAMIAGGYVFRDGLRTRAWPESTRRTDPGFWMPDSKTLVFAHHAYEVLDRKNEEGLSSPIARLVDSQTGAVVDSIPGIRAFAPASGGTGLYHLVTSSTDLYEACVFERTLADGADHKIYCGPYYPNTPVKMSPDGTMFAMMIPVPEDTTAMALSIVSVLSGVARVVDRTETGTRYWPVAWLPDSRRLVAGVVGPRNRFGKDVSTVFRLVSINDYSVATLPLDLGRRISGFAIHPDGKRIAYNGQPSASYVEDVILYEVQGLFDN